MAKQQTTSTKTKASKKKMDSTVKVILIVVAVFVGLALLSIVGVILFVGSIFNNAKDNIDTGNGTVTVQSDDGSSKTSFGENVTLAEGFPSDVPIYEPSNLVASTKVNDKQYSATARTADERTKVNDFYKSQMTGLGWTVQVESNYGEGSIITFKKDNRTASVSVNVQQEESAEKTFFVVSVGEQ